MSSPDSLRTPNGVRFRAASLACVTKSSVSDSSDRRMLRNARTRVMDSRIGLEANSSYENEYFQFISMKGKLGMVLTAVSQRGLSALLLGDDREELERDLRREFPDEKPVCGGYGLEGIGSRIVSFTEDPRIGVSLPLDVRGTAFQKRVWEELRSIPPGEQRTYFRSCRADRHSRRFVCDRSDVPRQSNCDRHSVPPGHRGRWRNWRLPVGHRAQARPSSRRGQRAVRLEVPSLRVSSLNAGAREATAVIFVTVSEGTFPEAGSSARRRAPSFRRDG